MPVPRGHHGRSGANRNAVGARLFAQVEREGLPGYYGGDGYEPWNRPSPAPADSLDSGSFSPDLYKKHREYNALIGAVAIYAALALRIYFAS